MIYNEGAKYDFYFIVLSKEFIINFFFFERIFEERFLELLEVFDYFGVFLVFSLSVIILGLGLGILFLGFECISFRVFEDRVIVDF